MPLAPRGIRNNNPGNIRKSKDKWQGLAANQPDPDFCTFIDPTFGIRALAKILISYQERSGCSMIFQFLNRYAPSSENDTNSYINAVAEHMGISPHAMIDIHHYATIRPMVEAIIRHENGQQPYSGEVIDKGLQMAGIATP